MFLVSSCSWLCPIQWSQVLSREWRCRWNYIWVIDNFIAYYGALRPETWRHLSECECYSQLNKHSCCWWLGAYLAPAHMQASWRPIWEGSNKAEINRRRKEVSLLTEWWQLRRLFCRCVLNTQAQLAGGHRGERNKLGAERNKISGCFACNEITYVTFIIVVSF